MFRPYVVNERQQYCTRACYFAAPKERSGEKNPNWKGGISKNHMRYKLRFHAKNPEKVAAHMEVYKAKRRGDLIPQPCETCGTDHRVAAHHEDYSKPLEVRWLCQPCHNREHSGPRAHFRVTPSKGGGFMWRGRWRQS